MKYGRFDDANREYVITRPDTPLPWINYLGCEEYFALISNTAGGYSFYRDARLRRLTRYRYNNIPYDSNGRYLYLRDRATGEFWSPTWQPTRSRLDEFSCRHGLGYSVISSQRGGISASTRYFVPLGETLEIWDLTLANKRRTAAQLDLFSFVEFCLWDAWDDCTNFQRNFSTGQVTVKGGTIYHHTEYRERRNHFAFFSCSEKLEGFDTARDAFLGPYGSLERPAVVASGRSTNSVAHGWAPVGSHHVRVTLKPGEQKRIIFVLGYCENPVSGKFNADGSINTKRADGKTRRYSNPKHVDSAFNALRKHWQTLLSRWQTTTPDEHVNRMVNVWNQYQCMVTFNMSRSASYFESGIGRGMGFRDSNQDLLGFVHMIPGRARERLRDIAATQMNTGGAYHQYQPLTKRGNNDIGGNFNDDPLWLVLGVAAYLKESGDFGFLNERIEYDNNRKDKGALYEHLCRSIEYTMKRMGPHKLPLIGRADWNDCLNLNCFSSEPGQSFQTVTNMDGKAAESVFIAGLFVIAAREMITLSESLRKTSDAKRFRGYEQRMIEAVEKAGWDGEWFRRAYDHHGNAIGSKRCAEGKVFIESNGICSMAGIGARKNWPRKALDAVEKHLATPHGIVLQQPAFATYHLELGEISSYPPGYKENAGIFCHTNPWIMIAEAMIGRGGKALDYYLRICPSARERISEIHRCEPYVYAQMIAGRDAVRHGEAKNSWLTGTAAWNLVAITQYILGVQAEYSGLRIDPCVPQTWRKFSVRRVYRGKECAITVRNP
ncbi:glycosyl transferase, partial [bacterium]|nr:glycosyl transferase [bacterium]